MNNAELVGDVGAFGKIVLNGSVEIGIFIRDEEAIMDAIFDFMSQANALLAERRAVWLD